MFGTSIGLTTARILSYSQRDDLDFNEMKLKALKSNFLQTIKRLGDYDLYKSYEQKLTEMNSDDALIKEIENLGQGLKKKGVDTKKVEIYADYVKRSLSATKESCVKTYNHLQNDIDIITPIKECKMSNTIKKFDEDGKIIPLFEKDENDSYRTFIDNNGNKRYLLNNDILDWEEAESFYKFVKNNNFKFHGHTIVWHETVPYQIQKIAQSNIPQEVKKKLTQDFLYGYMKSYAKSIKENGIELESLDVLNEIANDDTNSKDYLRKSIWRDLLGDDYYIDVLKMAKQVFPDVKLMYNDFGEFYSDKRKNILNIIKNIQIVERDEGIQLLDGVGLQCHLYGDDLDYDDALKEFKEVADNGPFPQEVRITELDSSPCDNPKWQQKQMEKVVEAAQNNGIEDITCWEMAGQFSDSIENSSNSGVVDKNGDETNVYGEISNSFSKKNELELHFERDNDDDTDNNDTNKEE